MRTGFSDGCALCRLFPGCARTDWPQRTKPLVSHRGSLLWPRDLNPATVSIFHCRFPPSSETCPETILSVLFSRSVEDPGGLCVTPGPPSRRRVRGVALAALHQDAAECGGGGESGDGQGLPCAPAPPGHLAPQPHWHDAAVRAAGTIK